MFGLIFLFLFLALITGVLSFGGFLVGSSLLIIFKVLFPIFVILFFISLIRQMLSKPKR